jgi:DNA mismatch repair protein MutL
MPKAITLPRIKTLSSSLANQIAAGEVIERPASVVKELLENSLDAHATRILIEVYKAGTQLIRVSDNGCGIHPEDLELALQRHATAKIKHQSDLESIRSLGFRGEALPSISSVADISVVSRIDAMEHAALLKFSPVNDESSLTPAAHPVGTTIEVRNLFHNTPARKKFLRSERTEYLHILEMVRRVALSRADVHIELKHNDQKILSCHSQTDDLAERVSSIMGQSFMSKAIQFEYRVGDMHASGWLGVGDLARNSTDRQYLYLNGRMIKDKRLNHAIRLAAEGLIAEGRFPSYVIYLALNLSEADVNVHPTKHEVRFKHARDVHDFLFSALSSSIDNEQNLYQSMEYESVEKDISIGSAEEDYSGKRHYVVSDIKRGYGDMRSNRQAELLDDRPALGQPLLQIHGKYLLAQREDLSLLISIDAAKKHIATMRLKSVTIDSPLTGRPLLVPIKFSITDSQEQTLGILKSSIEMFSLQLDLAGPNTCIVRVLPMLMENADIDLLVNELLQLDISKMDVQQRNQNIILTMVNHVSDIEAPVMSIDEMSTLLRQLEATGVDVNLRQFTPIWRCLSVNDLEKFLNNND